MSTYVVWSYVTWHDYLSQALTAAAVTTYSGLHRIPGTGQTSDLSAPGFAKEPWQEESCSWRAYCSDCLSGLWTSNACPDLEGFLFFVCLFSPQTFLACSGIDCHVSVKNLCCDFPQIPNYDDATCAVEDLWFPISSCCLLAWPPSVWACEPSLAVWACEPSLACSCNGSWVLGCISQCSLSLCPYTERNHPSPPHSQAPDESCAFALRYDELPVLR